MNQPSFERIIQIGSGYSAAKVLLSAVGLLIWRNALGSSGRPATDAAYQVYDPDASPLRGFALEPPRPAPDFTLIDPEGQPFRLAQSQGEARLLFFGYTECPDVCPQTLTRLAAGLRALGPRAERARVIFISVDPERDSLAHLQSYGAYFHPSILGITGDKARLDPIVESYGAAYRKVESASAMGYLIDHSSETYLIDRNGVLAEVLAHGTPPVDLLAALRRLLAQPQ